MKCYTIYFSPSVDFPMLETCRGHTRSPGGYVAWHEWAERKARTHIQHRCPKCGLWAIWKKRAND